MKGPDFGTPVYGSNLVFSFKQHEGLFALNASDGTVNWQSKQEGSMNTPPYYANGHVYVEFFYQDSVSVSKVDPLTGNVVWETYLDSAKIQDRTLDQLIAVGGNLYTKVFLPNAIVTKYLIFDTKTGALKDSLQIPGDPTQSMGIVTTADHYLSSN